MKKIAIALVVLFALAPYAWADEEIQLLAALGESAAAEAAAGSAAGSSAGTAVGVAAAYTTADLVVLGAIAAGGVAIVADAVTTTKHE